MEHVFRQILECVARKKTISFFILPLKGTEYASTSLFGSSTASNNGLSTMKKGTCNSASLVGSVNGVSVGQYPSPFISTTTGSGGAGSGGTSYHLYQPILVPAQQALLFQNAVAAAAAAAGGFGDSQQLGGLVQSSPFLSQGLLHSSALSPTVS